MCLSNLLKLIYIKRMHAHMSLTSTFVQTYEEEKIMKKKAQSATLFFDQSTCK